MLRKIAFASLALILAGGPAAAQLSGPLLLDQSGNVLAQRPYWQFLTTGGGTVCKAATVNGKPTNQCTTPQGGGGTLQGAYNNSAGASPSILETGGGGPVDIQGPAGAGIGALFRVRTTNAPDLLTIADSGASQINASGALNLDGGSAINVGATNATSINAGKSGITTTITGGLTQLTGAVSLAGNAASSFTTSAGALTLTSAAAATWSTSAGALTLTSAAASTWSTSAGTLTLNGTGGINLQGNAITLLDVGVTSATATTIAANKDLVGAAGTGNLTLGSMTGATTLPTGNLSWTAAATKTLTLSSAGAASVTSSGGALTLTGGAASTWSTSAGTLTLSAGGQLNQTSGLAAGATSAFVFNNTNDFLANLNVQFQNAGVKYIAFTPNSGNPQINMYDAGGNLNGAIVNGGTALRISSWTSLQPGNDILVSLGISSARWNGVYTTGVLGGASDITLTPNANVVWAANKGISAAAGTGAFDFSGGSGVFKTSTGASTFGGSSNSFTNTITLAANAGISTTAGTGAFDFSNGTGIFKTSTGAVTIGTGAITISGAPVFASVATTASGTSSFDLSGGSGVFKTPTGASTFGGSSNTFTNAIAAPALDQTAAGALNIGVTTATSVVLGAAAIPVNAIGNLSTGTSGAALKWTAAQATGIVTKYNNEATAGVGQSYIEAFGQDVAWNGVGSTTIATFAPGTSGLYRVQIVISCHTNNEASMSSTLAFTDAVDAHATTITNPGGIATSCTAGANTDTTSGTVLIRANTSSSITAAFTAANATTKASATIERVN